MTTTPEFTISRTYAAPRDLVFKAWTVPDLMAKWWGPKGFAVKSYKLDLRPGGSYHYCLTGPDGKAMWGKFLYREIVTPERLVYVNFFSDEAGGITRHPFNADWPLELLSTITFIERDGATELTVNWKPLNATETELKTFENGLTSMQNGWGGTLDQLAAYLATHKDQAA